LKIESFEKPIKVSVSVEIRPSESSEKVKKAVSNLLPTMCLQPANNDARLLVSESSDFNCLSALYQQIRARQTAGVFRRLYMLHLIGEQSWLYFHKQAAYVGVANVCEDYSESPLGPIKITFWCPDSDALLKWLVPL
jgi:predicted RNA binding protein with dsRBD fold (UPF0201 family)